MQTIKDTPYKRLTIVDLTDEQADAYIEGIRERRMRTFHVYEETQQRKKQARADKALSELDKQLAMLLKEIHKFDGYFEKLEARRNKVRALRLEIEDLNGTPLYNTGGEGDA